MTSRTIRSFLVVALLTSTSVAQNAIPAPVQQRPVALQGGTIHTVSGQVIQRGTLLFDKGKITAVAAQVSVPADAEVVDISGKHLYPGLIDAYNAIGLSEIGLGSPGTVDEAETGDINPSIRAEVAFHPESELIPVGRSGGVTVSLVAPSGGLISGTAAAMMLEGWTWEEMTLRSGVGMIVNWPRMVFAPSPFSRQTKEDWRKSRDRSLSALRDAFENARAYHKTRGANTGSGTRHDTDPSLAALAPVLEKRTPLIVNASELAEIQAAIAFAQEQDVRIIIAGGRDAWRMTDILASKNIPVIVTDLQTAGRRWEAYDVIFALPKKLYEAGVQFCITGDRSGSNIRNLSHQAGHASAYGLPHDEALKAITLYPAMILGIADRLGSLEVGKDATFFISDGDALEIMSKVDQVYIQGRRVDMRDKHVRLYEKYQEKYRQQKEGSR